MRERFEEQRGRLLEIATRMLGSAGPADDAVQEAWVRLTSGDAVDSDGLGGRPVTQLSRVCLQVLTGRTTRQDDVLDDPPPDPMAVLAPAERVAFVLHDLFAVPVEEVAGILGRTPTATRQLADRARRCVRSPERGLEADRAVQTRVVEAFLAASSTGDLEELAWLLHPGAVLHADPAAVAAGAVAVARGEQAVAEIFAATATGAGPAQLDGFAAAARSVGGRTEMVLGFTVVDGRVAEIEVLADPEVLPLLDLGPRT